MANNSAQRFASGMPLVGSFFDDTLDKAQGENEWLKGELRNIALPDYKDYVPEALQVGDDFRPEDALYETYKEDPRLRSAQMSALEKMAGYADDGLSADDEANFAKARSQAGQLMRSGNSAAMQNAQARGVSGSGLEYAMREMANQAAGEQAQTAGLAQANATAQGRLAALSKYEDGLTSMRGQDASVGQYNNNVVNQFNQANTAARNQAQLYNTQNRQQISNQNTDNRNEAQQYNNGLKQQTFNDQMQKFAGNNQLGQNAQQLYAADNAARTQDRNTRTKFLTDMMSSYTGGGAGK